MEAEEKEREREERQTDRQRQGREGGGEGYRTRKTCCPKVKHGVRRDSNVCVIWKSHVLIFSLPRNMQQHGGRNARYSVNHQKKLTYFKTVEAFATLIKEQNTPVLFFL
jgi:hypothetical protein